MTEIIKPNGYDIIGDIHGHADKLIALLQKMGYTHNGDCYRHPSRQAIFLGDFIDRGPQQRKTLDTVMPMVQQQAALAVMGNHEYNALAYHTEHPQRPGTWLRARTARNRKQHQAFIDEYVENGEPRDFLEVLDFFRSLPLWLELDGIRVIHAAWHPASMATLSEHLGAGNTLTSACLVGSSEEGTELFKSLETVLKGVEIKLPLGMCFKDHQGTERTQVRCWFFKEPADSLGDMIVHPHSFSEEIQRTQVNTGFLTGYAGHERPIFVGHYWMGEGPDPRPQKLADNVACVDYSSKKGGELVAYRWSGESKLKNENYVYEHTIREVLDDRSSDDVPERN